MTMDRSNDVESEEAKRVLEMSCIACERVRTRLMGLAFEGLDPVEFATTKRLLETMLGSGPSVTAYVIAAGGRFDLVPLCSGHFREAGDVRSPMRSFAERMLATVPDGSMRVEKAAWRAEVGMRETFSKRYRLNLRKAADDIALEHPDSPGFQLGIRGLARMFAEERTSDELGGARLLLLDAYERGALLGWVRREMASEIERRTNACYVAHERCDTVVCMRDVNERPPCDACGDDGLAADDREALADHIGATLGSPFSKVDGSKATALAWALCEAAGWP